MLNIIWLIIMSTIVAGTYLAIPALTTVVGALWWIYLIVSMFVILGTIGLFILASDKEQLIKLKDDPRMSGLNLLNKTIFHVKTLIGMAVFAYAGWTFALATWLLFWLSALTFNKAFEKVKTD